MSDGIWLRPVVCVFCLNQLGWSRHDVVHPFICRICYEGFREHKPGFNLIGHDQLKDKTKLAKERILERVERMINTLNINRDDAMRIKKRLDEDIDLW